jgi:hypothetical protein
MKFGIGIVAFSLITIFLLSGCSELNIGRASISQAYHTQIDRLAPNYLHAKKLACNNNNGEWFDTATKVGCFEINVPWDSSTCSDSTEIILMRNVCDGITGAEWVCDINNVGCYYE